MNTEEGIVTKVDQDRTWVRVRRSSMCEGCKTRGACYTLSGDKDMESEVSNPIGARVGDRVVLQISSGSLLKASFLFYMVPVLFLVVGIVLGMKLGSRYGGDPEIFAALTGIAAAALSFLIIKIFSRRFRDNEAYKPEIIKIINSKKNS